MGRLRSAQGAAPAGESHTPGSGSRRPGGLGKALAASLLPGARAGEVNTGLCGSLSVYRFLCEPSGATSKFRTALLCHLQGRSESPAAARRVPRHAHQGRTHVSATRGAPRPDTRHGGCPLLSRGRPGEDSPQTPPGPLGTLPHVNGLPGRAPRLCPPSQGTGSYLMKPRNTSRTRLTSHPAEAKALGMVRAPVPTMRLNMYTSPTWKPRNGRSAQKRICRSPQHPWDDPG